MHGLYLIWWTQAKDVPIAMVATLLAAGDLAITALEIPTGWLADRFGHRVSLIAGSLFQIAGMLCSWLGRGVPGLSIAILLVAVGDAFRSGADQALLYRSCVALRREADFQAIEARARAAQLVALVAMTLAGGAIVNAFGFAAGWIVESAICAIGLAMAAVMIEPPPVVEEREPTVRPKADTTPGARLKADTTYAWLIVPAAVVVSAGSAALFVAQTSSGIDPMRVSVLVAVVTLVEAAGAMTASRLSPAMSRQLIVAACAVVATVLAVTLPSSFLAATVALAFLMGVAQPLRAATIQRHVDDCRRAQAASMASACDRALATLGLLIVGWWPGKGRGKR